MSNVYARPFTPSSYSESNFGFDGPKVQTINPLVQVSSGTSLSDRFSQLYQKRRQNMVPEYEARQTTTRYTNAMTRRTGETPTPEMQQEVYNAAFTQRSAPFFAPPVNGGGPQAQPNQRRGGYQGGFANGNGSHQPGPDEGAPAPAPRPAPRPSQPPPPPRSWHVVRGGALQPQGPVHANRPTAPPQPMWGPPPHSQHSGQHGGRGGFAPRGRGRGRGGYGGYGGRGFDRGSLDADLDDYMRADAKTGAAALDADLDAWKLEAEVAAAAGPQVQPAAVKAEGDSDAQMAE